MPGDRRAKKVAAALEDRISALPDGILQHVLGFLPADEAVRTCVLARHWRHQWRSVHRLHIIYPVNGPRSFDDFVRYVNRLLLLRAPSLALDEFQLSNDDVGDFDPEMESLELDPQVEEEIHIWIRHVLLWKVQVMIIDLPITLDTPLISQHLRRLEVTQPIFRADCLDFATCPALEFLDMTYCSLHCTRILSQSVKHLRIIKCHFLSDSRTCISMPSLISLQLNNFHGKAPLLEFMPSLQTAFVKARIWAAGLDTCKKTSHSGDDCCGICANCCGEDDHRGRCILLGGLSSAIYLELLAHHGTSIFRRDLIWCPTFSKLKTLLLNECFVAIDLSALVCILEHSPVLEKLILHISQDAKCKPESEGRNHQTEREPQVSEHLKIVEIKCKNVGFRVLEISSFFSTFVMQVNIIRVTRDLNLFSFEN